jgi:hypothetical protein
MRRIQMWWINSSMMNVKKGTLTRMNKIRRQSKSHIQPTQGGDSYIYSAIIDLL